MDIEIREEGANALAEYAKVSIAFRVESVLELGSLHEGSTGMELRENQVEVPYIKNYDELPGGGPTAWSKRFDVSRWGVFTARSGVRLIGGAVVAVSSANVRMLEERADLAVLWDIRVARSARGGGVGTKLFRAAEAWAATRKHAELKVETQDVNVPACRFYAKQGCILSEVNRFAYGELCKEVQLIWRKQIQYELALQGIEQSGLAS
jgi:GNAT superfamily N-acetyltransferase